MNQPNGLAGILVLGVDPGPTTHAWSLVRVIDLQRGEFLACGKLEGKAELLARPAFLQGATVVAIESPSQFIPQGARGFIPAVASALFGTTRQVGRLASIAEDRGLEVVEMTATDWRREVCGKGASKDDAVAADIARLIPNWPKRSNAHVRDAAGVALAAGWAWVRRQGRAA